MTSMSLVDSVRHLRTSGVSGLRQFWAWWLTEIIALLPDRLRRTFDDEKPILVVTVHDDTNDVHLHQSDKALKVATLSTDDDSPDLVHKIRARLDRLSTSIATSIVELPEASVLRRSITLPLDAEERLADVLGYEMDRITPFKNDKVYWDFTIVDRNKAARTIEVLITVAKKSAVDRILDRLASFGLKPSAVAVQDTISPSRSRTARSATINLLPSEQRINPAREKRYLSTVLAALVVLLACTAVLLPLMHQWSVEARLDSQIDRVRADALLAQDSREEIERVVRQRQFFAKKRRESPSILQLLDEVTRILPDDTVLLRFGASGNHLRIQGESESASSLLRLIEDSRLFRNARFSSPVTSNPGTKLDRFAVEAQIITGPDDS